MIIQQIPARIISSELFENLVEAQAEALQDQSRGGFQNLGQGNNVLSSPASFTSSLRINGQAGNDVIQLFGTGDDVIHTGSGNDRVFAGAGDDEIRGGSGNDTLDGFDGNDEIFGGSGQDEISGGIGFDQLFGGSGNDLIFGGAGADILDGGTGDDRLFGDHDVSPTAQQGRDTLSGGFGNDFLSGGGGADVLIGGAGSDTFAFDHHNDLSIGHTDVIRDFSRTEGDKIDLGGIDANASVNGNQAFHFSENGPSTQAGTFWFGTYNADSKTQTVFLNRDGGAAELSIIVTLNDANMTGLQASDFFL
jgi:Ca2+-binding RTX toxin-like protein